MKRFVGLLVVLLVLVGLMGCEATPQPTVSPLATPAPGGAVYGPDDWQPGDGDPGGPKDVVRWLATGGGVVAAGWLASWLCSVWPWFNRLESEYKELVSDLLGVLIPFGAGMALAAIPEQWWAAVQDAWPVVLALVGLVGTKLRYASVVKAEKASLKTFEAVAEVAAK